MIELIILFGVSAVVGFVGWLLGYAMGSHDYKRLMENE